MGYLIFLMTDDSVSIMSCTYRLFGRSSLEKCPSAPLPVFKRGCSFLLLSFRNSGCVLDANLLSKISLNVWIWKGQEGRSCLFKSRLTELAGESLQLLELKVRPTSALASQQPNTHLGLGRKRSLLPTVAPASHARNVGCPPHCCWAGGCATKCHNSPKFPSPALETACVWAPGFRFWTQWLFWRRG